MKNSKTSTDKSKISSGTSRGKAKRSDDSELSKNHSKSVKFRLRVQQEKEAVEEIKEHERFSGPEHGAITKYLMNHNNDTERAD
jgi:hypothetical protein